MSIRPTPPGFSNWDKFLWVLLYVIFFASGLGLAAILIFAPMTVVAGSGIGACSSLLIVSGTCLVIVSRSFRSYQRACDDFNREADLWAQPNS